MKILNFSKKEWSWALFDWANSAYATTVMAGFFPIFFKTYYSENISSVNSTFILGLGISIASFIVAFLNPFLGYLTDVYQSKKLATTIASGVTCISLIGLSLTSHGQWLIAILFFGMSLIGFNLVMSFYDSLIKLVTSEDKEHQVSSLGYALGYLGGGSLFALNVAMVEYHQFFFISNRIQAVKISFLTVVIWWIVFSIPFWIFISENKKNNIKNNFDFNVNVLSIGQILFVHLKDFHTSLKFLLKNKNVLIFLLSYWLYIDVVYTIINMATDYGTAIGLGSSSLIKALLLVQFLGFPSTFILGQLTKYVSTKIILILLLGVYLIILIWAYYMKSEFDFWILAIFVSLAQGGVQALSRSFFAKLIGVDQSGEWFGVFNLIGRFASILGPLVVSFITYLSQDHRLGLLGLLFPLLLGIFFLLRVK